MGNSGSGHNISGQNNHDSQVHQNGADFIFPRSHHLQQQSELQHHQQKWSQKSPNNNLHSHVKVLPEFKSGPTRLRPTNNGCILQNGGTISGRKDSMVSSGSNVFRSSSISSDNEQQKKPISNNRLMQRSHTQLDISVTKRNHEQSPAAMEILPINFKRFDSEPNLSNDNNNNKITKNAEKSGGQQVIRKKRAAPPAPVILASSTSPATTKEKVESPTRLTQHKQRSSVEYDPYKFGWKSDEQSQSKMIVPPSEVQAYPPRKSRLFKTKAESNKKIPTAATANKATNPHHHTEVGPNNGINGIPTNDNNAMPKFRREKSFDLSLLLMNKHKSQTTIIPNESTILRGTSQKLLENANKWHTPLKSTKHVPKSNEKIDKGDVLGKSFKDELLAATRRRSLAMAEDSNKMSRMPANESTAPRVTAIVGKRSASVPKKCFDEQKEVVRSSSYDDKIPDADPMDNQHTKTFYFGMHPSNDVTKSKENVNTEIMLTEKYQIDVIDKFAENLHASAEREYNGETDSDSDSIISLDHNNIEYNFVNPELSSTNNVDAYMSRQRAPSMFNEIGNSSSDIQVLMQPTLPRRQFDIPRFSPAAAWRTLAQQFDRNYNSTTSMNHYTDESNVDSLLRSSQPSPTVPSTPIEDRIERIYREPPMPIMLAVDNKSGDSGISGDGGILPVDVPTVDKVGPFLLPWTPQQDLDEDSSSNNDDINELGKHDNKDDDDDDEHLIKQQQHKTIAKTKYSSYAANVEATPNMFSLSLPRDSHMAAYGERLYKQQINSSTTFNSLQKLKRTVSGAFSNGDNAATNGSINGKQQTAAAPSSLYRNDNWLLSRSAPNSIDANLPSSSSLNHNDDETDNNHQYNVKSHHQNYFNYNADHHEIGNQPPSFNFLTSGKHVMYLPLNPETNVINERFTPGGGGGERSLMLAKDTFDDLGISHKENLQDEMYEDLLPANNQQTQPKSQQPQPQAAPHIKLSSKSRGHRFAFQSTIRQIERRRLAERLSKEAEQKEAQRLSELEAMRRVEEEFQKKRAREKASIRQQLRLFSMGADKNAYNPHHNQYNSLPIDVHIASSSRADPDGAVASPTVDSISPNFNNSRIDDGTGIGAMSTIDEYIDTRTPYISRIVQQKSSKNSDRFLGAKPSQQTQQQPFTTDVLSEFRTSRREYVEYRSSERKPSSADGGVITTKHPGVTCKIPQSNYMYDFDSADNYRRDFAHGRSVCSSDSEVSTIDKHKFK